MVTATQRKFRVNACLIAESPLQLRTLEEVAKRTGFGSACAGIEARLSQAGQDAPLTFFLFHYRLSAARLAEELRRLRSIEADNLRFSPAVLFISSAVSASDIAGFIRLGFDDLVVLPEAPQLLRRRFAEQINRPITYFETATYLGPDRRRAVVDPVRTSRRGAWSGTYMRHIIRRTISGGIDVLNTETVVRGAGPADASTTLALSRAPLTTATFAASRALITPPPRQTASPYVPGLSPAPPPLPAPQSQASASVLGSVVRALRLAVETLLRHLSMYRRGFTG